MIVLPVMRHSKALLKGISEIMFGLHAFEIMHLILTNFKISVFLIDESEIVLLPPYICIMTTDGDHYRSLPNLISLPHQHPSTAKRRLLFY